MSNWRCCGGYDDHYPDCWKIKMENEFIELKRQNEIMAEALKSISEAYISGDSVYDGASCMQDVAREALAKCGKGGSV